jgi:hypothetical protein
MIIVLIFEGRIKIGKMCIISTTKTQNQTNVDAKEEFEGSKGVISKSKDRQNNDTKSTKGQTMI